MPASPHRSRRLFPLAALLAALPLVAPTRAAAQVENLDPGQMVDGLRNYGLSDLLVYYANTEAPDDGLTPRLIEIAGHRLVFADESLAATPDGRARRADAIAAAIAAQQQMVADNFDHPQRALWQTDLAEMVLLNQLTVVHALAPDFVAFGVPTTEQADAFNNYVGVAAVAGQQAQEGLYDLKGTLPGTRNYTQIYVNTGLADRIFEDYGEGLTPMFEGMAALYASMLPDDAPYWSSGKADVLMAADSVDAERERLQALAVTRLTEFMDSSANISPGYRRAAKAAYAMALSRAGRHDEALTALEQVMGESSDDLVYVRAGLAKAFAEERSGKPDVALRTVTALLENVRANHPEWLFQQLLITDARFRLQSDAGGDVDPYEGYFVLLDGIDDEATRRGIEAYLAQRWAVSIDQADSLGAVPVAVRDAVGSYRALQGSALITEELEPGRANPDYDPDQGAELLAASIPVNESLLDESVPPASRLRGAYHLALAEINLKPTDPDVRVQAAGRLVELAAEYPAEPDAAVAIRAAVLWLQQFHNQVKDRVAQFAELDGAYRRACEVLLADFSTTEIADATRWYYAGQVLYNQDSAYAEAAEVLDGVPRQHPDYFGAQTLRLQALWNAYRFGDEATRGTLLADLTRAATRVQTDARDADPERADAARRAAAQATIANANVALANGQADAALVALAAFEDTYVRDDADAPLRIDATQTRLFALSALGDDDGMKDVARRFMNDYPDQAAATINRVVSDNGLELEQLTNARAGAAGLRAQELDEQIARKGEVGFTLASLLVDWSQGGNANVTPEQQLGFRLLEAKSLWLMGNAGEAVRRLEPIHQANGNNLQVVHYYAEALYHQGLEGDAPDEAVLGRAFQLYGSIDNSLKNRPDPGPFWWNARLRQLQVFDAVRPDSSRDIIRNIRQLEGRDESLGGSPYREAFQRLVEKHSSNA